LYSIDLNGHVAVVTGGGGGIGRAVAALLASADATVAVVDSDFARAELTVERAKWNHGRAAAFACDVRDSDSADAVIEAIMQAYGHVDMLVNVAGIWANGNIIDMPAAQVRELIDTNLLGALWMSRAAWEPLKASGNSSIVNIGSVQAHGVYVEPNMYNVTKLALEAQTGMLALQGAPHNIRVNCVAPGPIATPGMGNWQKMPESFVDLWRTAIPLGRRGTPEEVAHAVLMLCAPGASYISGATIAVDGALPWERRPTPLLPAPVKRAEDPDAR
jgi:NAD(P)-dependent dehydrogenase (short-subunit alcohol dehydrogenase family)